MDRNCDIVVVYGGVNDYAHGDAPIGTPEDTTPSTFYGAVGMINELFNGGICRKNYCVLDSGTQNGCISGNASVTQTYEIG